MRGDSLPTIAGFGYVADAGACPVRAVDHPADRDLPLGEVPIIFWLLIWGANWERVSPRAA